MTDDAEAFYNAWREVFALPHKRLLCSWHIDKNWRKKLIQLISSKENQARVYKILRCLLTETDLETFEIMLEQALKIFSEDTDLASFKNYFERY